MGARCRILSMFAVALLVACSCSTSSDESAVLDALGAEEVWSGLPQGAEQVAFSGDSHCSGNSGRAEVWMRVQADDTLVAVKYYLEVLQDTDWSIVEQDLEFESQNVVAIKDLADGSVALHINGWDRGRVELRAYPTEGC